MNETHENDDLRAMFAEATSEVRPTGSFEEILERTRTQDAGARRWFVPAVAAAAVIGVVVGGLSWALHDDSPARHGGPSGTPTGAAVTPAFVPVYYLGDTASGPRLFAEQVPATPRGGTPAGIAKDAVERAVAGAPADPDYRSPWPAGITVNGLGGCVERTDECDIQVDLGGQRLEERPAGMSEEVARLAVDAVIRTARAAMGNNDPVFFTHYTADGTQPLEHLLGVPIAGNLSPLADDDELAPVQITTPAFGATVPAGDLVVKGVAAAYEANVQWELLVGGDTVVKQGHATAAECCTLSPYSFTIHGLEPGSYTLVVHDTDESGAGRPVNQDSKDLTVR